jgi:predicted transcriptional regulator
MANSNALPSDKVSLSAEIVAAYVSHNSVTPGGLPALVESVHGALTNLGAVAATPKPEPPVPAVSIRKSITPDYLICLDDGKKFKSLKRHLTTLGLTADQYRQKWNLPQDYPMVAPAYAAKRSELAKELGLGQLGKNTNKRKSGRKPKAAMESPTSWIESDASVPPAARNSLKSPTARH